MAEEDRVAAMEAPSSAGIPLQRDSFPSYSEAHGIGANVQTLIHDKRKIKRLDAQEGGLSLDTLAIKPNGLPELSNDGSPSTTSADSSLRTPPFSSLKHGDLAKPSLVSRASSGYASTDVSSAEHSAAGSDAEDELRPAPKKEDSIATLKPETVKPALSSKPAEPVSPVLDERTVPLTPAKGSLSSPPLSASSSPRPGDGRKTSTVGKLFQHRDKAPTPPASLPTPAAGLKHPPPTKSAGARSPALVQSGDESDGGHQSDTSTSSATSALRSFGRRFSSKKDEAPPKPQAPDDQTAQMARRGSSKAKTSVNEALAAPNVDGRTGKMERKKSEKVEKHEHMTLKDYVAAHAGKMTRKPSSASHKSDDDRSSTKGDDETASLASRNRSGSTTANTTASLLKKYGVCEKAAIGKGATAVVRLAHKWDRTTERLYAVKEFRKRRKNETEREYVKKLTSEFCISSTLHHPHVVETVDLVQDENHHWCEVMEYCPGGDLYAAIKKGDMNIKEIHSYFKQTVLGIAYLHSMGVAHRDIKPENLLLDAKGHVKITDFGVSDVFRMCWEKGTHLSKGLCGSEPYIAPEQFENKEYDARMVDVWAAAIVFYCMVAQELPWRAARKDDPTFASYAERYAQPNPPPLHTIMPRECRQLIKRMLDPNPKTRIMIEQVAEDPWLAGIEILETTPPGHSSSAAL